MMPRMGTTRTGPVVRTLPGGKRMTLGEIRSFVAEMDQAGAADTTQIGARVNFGGWLRELKATAVRFGDPEPR